MEAVKAANELNAEARERTLLMFEREIGFRRHLFARERFGTRHLITLTGITVGARMPTRNVAWSQTFADAGARDDLFACLADRVHVWNDWGELAYSKGADALTRHLLSVIVGTGPLAK